MTTILFSLAVTVPGLEWCAACASLQSPAHVATCTRKPHFPNNPPVQLEPEARCADATPCASCADGGVCEGKPLRHADFTGTERVKK